MVFYFSYLLLALGIDSLEVIKKNLTMLPKNRCFGLVHVVTLHHITVQGDHSEVRMRRTHSLGAL